MKHDPTIHGSAMHDLCINYPNNLKLCRKNYATGKQNLAEQNNEFFSLLEQLLLHYITWNLVVFSRLINIYKVTE